MLSDNTRTEQDLKNIIAIIRCPKCKSASLRVSANSKTNAFQIECEQCHLLMPSFDELACVTINNQAFLAQWQARLQILEATIAQRRLAAKDQWS